MKTYHGSCHCGAVRFEADIDLTQNTYRCNCSVCSKTRFWPAIVKPEHFRLLLGQGELTQYLFNTRKNHHYFCRHCGVRSFGIGSAEDEKQRMYGVNVTCLDDVTVEELAKAPITYVDGRHDRWHAAPEEIRYL